MVRLSPGAWGKCVTATGAQAQAVPLVARRRGLCDERAHQARLPRVQQEQVLYVAHGVNGGATGRVWRAHAREREVPGAAQQRASVFSAGGRARGMARYLDKGVVAVIPGRPRELIGGGDCPGLVRTATHPRGVHLNRSSLGRLAPLRKQPLHPDPRPRQVHVDLQQVNTTPSYLARLSVACPRARARAADAEAVGGPILCATSDEVVKAGRLRRGRQRQARQAEAEARASDAANVVRMALLLFQPATLAPAQA